VTTVVLLTALLLALVYLEYHRNWGTCIIWRNTACYRDVGWRSMYSWIPVKRAVFIGDCFHVRLAFYHKYYLLIAVLALKLVFWLIAFVVCFWLVGC